MKILFVSLGCDKNLVDSEVMLGLLREKQYEITDDEQQADVVVVNTCCFIHDAKEESITTILEMAELKKTAKVKAIVVTGCLAERYKEEIRKEIPEVDAVLGTSSYEAICEAVDEALEGHVTEKYEDINYLPVPTVKRINTTGGYFSYLKIAEGCDKHCTYCIIPKIRGDYRSVPMEKLIAEAKQLAESGVEELILVAQETTMYGKDLYGEKKLPELLRELCKIAGIKWIRILYCYPEEITDELIDVIANNEKVVKYLDIPIQHISSRILKLMARKTNKEAIIEKIEKLREKVPGIALRTSLIVGFPGETEEDFKELKEFVEDYKLDNLGVFAYSREEDTAAARMDNQIDEEIKEVRKNEIMKIQRSVVKAQNKLKIGKIYDTIIDGQNGEYYIARNYSMSPEIDGVILIKNSKPLSKGDIVKVKIVDVKEYDLIGDVL